MLPEFCLLGLLLLAGAGVSQVRRSTKASVSVSASQVVDFNCPEEFGYYPHPDDCTQYYVCVFGGALLESCTGGLMYSHELQTCDWPRNVGCGEVVSTAKAVEVRPRPQPQQQYVQQRPLQRDEAIPKHHLYAEEDLGPAEELESDRQQRVYRGQPSTLGQVARDRDGLARHSNALQISPPNGREKLSVISFGTQQQYSRQHIQPAQYVEPTTTPRVTSRGYNATQQYTPSPYDPYYNIYEDDSDLYKDIDYSQYSGQQAKQVQPQVQPTRKPTIQYSPPPPQPSYNAVQQEVYLRGQDYTDNYNLQDEDIDYKQTDLDIKANRSPPPSPTMTPILEAKENKTNVLLNKRITLTAAFSFDNEKTPVTNSKQIQESVRQKNQTNYFEVQEPPNNGPLRKRLNELLDYIREENTNSSKTEMISNEERKTEEKNEKGVIKNRTTPKTESQKNTTSQPYSFYLTKKGTTLSTSTAFFEDDKMVVQDMGYQPLRSYRPFRIVVSSTTQLSSVEQVTLNPISKSNTHQINTSVSNIALNQVTVRPYKLPPLASGTVSSQKSYLDGSYVQPPTVSERLTSQYDHEDVKYVTVAPHDRMFQSIQEDPFQSFKTFRHNAYENHTIIQREKYPARGPSTLTRDVGRGTTQYTSPAPEVEQVVFKLIPIHTVKSGHHIKESFSTNNQEQIENLDYSGTKSKEQPENKSTSQNGEHSTKLIPQMLTEQKINDPARNKTQEQNTGTVNTQQIKPSKSRFLEMPYRKPLYSLRIDKDTGKYKGQINGVVLATLETVTDVTNNSRLTQHIEIPNVRSSASEEEKIPEGQKDEVIFQYTSRNNNNAKEQIFPRPRGRTVALNVKNIRDEAFTPPSLNITPLTNEKPLNRLDTARIHPRPNQNRLEHDRSASTSLVTNRLEHDNSASTSLVPEYESIINKQAFDKKQSEVNTNINTFQNRKNVTNSGESNYNSYPKRRQFKGRNRFRPNFEGEHVEMKTDFSSLDSENETLSIQTNKITTEGDLITKDNYYSPQPTQLMQPYGDEEYNSEYTDSRTDYERQPNIRQMTDIKKRIRYTTLKPQFYDDNKKIPSKVFESQAKANSVDLYPSPESSMTQTFANEVDTLTNTEPGTINHLKNWSATTHTSEDSNSENNDSNNYFKETSYRHRGRIFTRNRTRDKEYTTTPTVVSFTPLTTSSVLRAYLRNKSISSGYADVPDSVSVLPQGYISIAANESHVPTSSSSTVDLFKDEVTTNLPPSTIDKIRDKFRLGNFPKPTPSSNGFARKPSVEDSIPPPLPSDKCSQELDDNPECNDRHVLRLSAPASLDNQATRGGSRNRGSATYTVSPNEAEPSLPPNRGTPSSLTRNRPTLKPSTSIVSKASDYIDIFKYPPSRPEPIYPTPQVDKTAAKCRKDVCLLPDCNCGGKDIPGDLTLEETPQIVLLTFDDSVNDLNKGLYSDLFEKGRVNPNGCPISATFYVSHEWTDYSQVQNLYASGHEMASHTVSHSFGEQFSVKKWTKEVAGQREILSAYGGVRLEDIRGMRAPFLSIGGNKMFKMLYDSNFTYDSSMPVYENKPPSWPYTLDYKIFHDCMIPPCPTRSYPGVWEVPMVMWQDLNGGRCSMGDACSNPPAAEGVTKMLLKNFERHFTSNRAPFGLFYHAAWFTQPHHKEGFIAFLDAINKMPEVWLVTNWQAIQWVRDPTPISRLNSFTPFQCKFPERPRRCNNPKVCNLWHKSGVRYMRTCQPCPEIYPWTGKSGVRNSRVDNEIISE